MREVLEEDLSTEREMELESVVIPFATAPRNVLIAHTVWRMI